MEFSKLACQIAGTRNKINMIIHQIAKKYKVQADRTTQ